MTNELGITLLTLSIIFLIIALVVQPDNKIQGEKK